MVHRRNVIRVKVSHGWNGLKLEWQRECPGFIVAGARASIDPVALIKQRVFDSICLDTPSDPFMLLSQLTRRYFSPLSFSLLVSRVVARQACLCRCFLASSYTYSVRQPNKFRVIHFAGLTKKDLEESHRVTLPSFRPTHSLFRIVIVTFVIHSSIGSFDFFFRWLLRWFSGWQRWIRWFNDFLSYSA